MIPTATESNVVIYAARVELVRRIYGIGHPLPAVVTVFAEVPLDLPIARRAWRRPDLRRDDTDPCRKCGEVNWVRRACCSWRSCRTCEQRRNHAHEERRKAVRAALRAAR